MRTEPENLQIGSTDHPLATLAVHAGRSIDTETGAVAPPIHLTTTFERDRDGTYPRGFVYSTFENPNRSNLENAITELEGGAATVAAASGMAAIASVLSSLDPGDRIVVAHDLFQGTARLLNDQFRKWGIVVDYADTTDLDSISSVITPETRMIWLDTPSNPFVRVSDIEAVVEFARSKKIRIVVDSTFATFILQRPLDLGADATVYAATKFIAGHSDVVNGLAVFREQGELYERARSFQINIGAVPSPFDAWLVHRGLPTLAYRICAQSETALKIARFVENDDRVERVYYPGLVSDESHEIARRQMQHGYGGVISFTLAGGFQAAMETQSRVQLFTRASSLGGCESLIEHRASSPIQTQGQGTGMKIPDNLIRLSAGLERAEDLVADLDQAMPKRKTS